MLFFLKSAVTGRHSIPAISPPRITTPLSHYVILSACEGSLLIHFISTNKSQRNLLIGQHSIAATNLSERQHMKSARLETCPTSLFHQAFHCRRQPSQTTTCEIGTVGNVPHLPIPFPPPTLPKRQPLSLITSS